VILSIRFKKNTKEVDSGMVNQQAREETALKRHEIMSPILWAQNDGADSSKLRQLQKEVCEKHGISERTMRRWLASYKGGDFAGLKPKERIHNGPGAITDDILKEAILLRREVPGRSVSRIIEILEMEGKVPAGAVKRTTLQDRFMESGYSTRQMKLYQQDGIAARRYQRKNRGDLWFSDIKYSISIKIDGKKTPTYMVCFQDDYSRYIVHAEFYTNMEQAVVEDCMHKAVLKEGVPKRVMFDNGSQYRNKWMRRACAILGIKLTFAKPMSPASKGKCERFNRTVDAFLDEVSLMNVSSLDELNKYFKIWLTESYHQRPHCGLKDNITPTAAYYGSKEPLRFLPQDTITAAFLHEEERMVDKSGCISFQGRKYEVGVEYLGQKVGVIYDPGNTEKLTIEHKPSGRKFSCKKLVIGEHTGPRPKLPEYMTKVKPETSRLLNAEEKRARTREEAVVRAIKYSGFVAEGGGAE